MPPVATKPFSEPRKCRQVTRNRVVLVVTLHHPFQPRPDERDRLMHHPAQLLLDNSELCPHPLRRRMPPDHKATSRVRVTEVYEPEERECFRLFSPSLPSLGRRKASELDQPCLFRNLQPRTSPTDPESSLKGSGANSTLFQSRQISRSIDRYSDYAASAAFQIAAILAVAPLSFPNLYCPFLIFSASSTPLITIAAVRKLFSPSMGRSRCFTRR